MVGTRPMVWMLEGAEPPSAHSCGNFALGHAADSQFRATGASQVCGGAR